MSKGFRGKRLTVSQRRERLPVRMGCITRESDNGIFNNNEISHFKQY